MSQHFLSTSQHMARLALGGLRGRPCLSHLPFAFSQLFLSISLRSALLAFGGWRLEPPAAKGQEGRAQRNAEKKLRKRKGPARQTRPTPQAAKGQKGHVLRSAEKMLRKMYPAPPGEGVLGNCSQHFLSISQHMALRALGGLRSTLLVSPALCVFSAFSEHFSALCPLGLRRLAARAASRQRPRGQSAEKC